MAQSVEQLIRNQQVAGSSPATSSIILPIWAGFFFILKEPFSTVYHKRVQKARRNRTQLQKISSKAHNKKHRRASDRSTPFGVFLSSVFFYMPSFLILLLHSPSKSSFCALIPSASSIQAMTASEIRCVPSFVLKWVGSE